MGSTPPDVTAPDHHPGTPVRSVNETVLSALGPPFVAFVPGDRTNETSPGQGRLVRVSGTQGRFRRKALGRPVG